ncbi:MAG TPA: L-histidine N(alpha)-methyltransferase [Patescibacteria group bacterium]|jgi:uncharacterized SAM-dependent methyltransferase|nr:L-histidine N(alpha)-methyltransferase [Patescibacteria group bacterium]
MQYFKNAELTKLYNVSFTAVSNWIEAAQKNRLDLQLHQVEDKFYVANTAKNQALIEEMVQERKKYLTTRALKVVTPSLDFYKRYSREQILDLISNITVHREVPLQFTYFDEGAHHWDRYARWMLNEKTPNTLRDTIELLESNIDSIDRLLQGRKHINVIDLGVGNALPIKDLLAHLLKRGTLNRYIAIDISKEMLSIAEQNIKEWFGGAVRFEGYIRDITSDRFKDLLSDDYLSQDEPLNLVALFGGTLPNFHSPGDVLRTIYNSMEPGDLFIHALKLDTPDTRRIFDLSEEKTPLNTQFRLLPDLLNIDESWYDVEQFFDEQDQARTIRIRLKIELSIRFDFGDKKRMVNFKKGDTITLWRYGHFSATNIISLLAANGFPLLQSSQTSDHTFLLTVCDIKP